MDSVLVNLLLFPLVGGYYITTRLESSKYIGQRRTSQAVLFNAVMVAIPLLLVSLCVTGLSTHFFVYQVTYIKDNYFPIKDQYLGTCVLSFVIAVGFTKIANRYFINRTKAIYKAIREVGNELEVLLSESCLEGSLVQITLKNSKVYVGWVEVLPEPSACPYIHLIPFLSGFRDAKRVLHITTDYSPVYNELIKKGKIKAINDSNVNIIIQSNQIISAAKFDFDIFEKFMLLMRKDHDSNGPE